MPPAATSGHLILLLATGTASAWCGGQCRHITPPPLPGNIHAQVSVGHATSNTAGTCPELQRTTDGQHLMIRNPLVCFNLASGRHATSTPPPPPHTPIDLPQAWV